MSNYYFLAILTALVKIIAQMVQAELEKQCKGFVKNNMDRLFEELGFGLGVIVAFLIFISLALVLPRGPPRPTSVRKAPGAILVYLIQEAADAASGGKTRAYTL